eukprot:scaffold17321_cov70-Phaeocystis_antarctica.AAC.2
MDIAAFKVGHSAISDKDATALQAARAGSQASHAGAMEEMSWNVQRRAHIASLISVHVCVGERCRAQDVESSAILPTMSTRNVPAGRWMKVQGKFKRRAHGSSLILVHVGVGQRCRARVIDVESSAILPTMSTRNVPAGRWNVTCVGSIRRKTHEGLPRHTANSEHTIGAMERYTWVRCTEKLTLCHTTHIATVSTPAGRWMKCRRRFKERAHR